MGWELALLIIFISLIIILASGMPVAFGFMLITIVGMLVYWGGEASLRQLTLSFFDSVTKFTLIPAVLFILMGEIMFRSGIVTSSIDAIDKLIGALPGRLSLIAVVAGALFATMSGSGMAGAAVLGSTLLPEMERHGYQKSMTLGPILAGGPLAIVIPPSGLAVVLASLAEISIGKILIGGIIPGLIMVLSYAAYITIRCYLKPSLAPRYETRLIPFSNKVISLVRYVLPMGFIIIMVLGAIFAGVATPSEAAATGVFGAVILAAAYKRLNWGVIKQAVISSTRVGAMVLMIIVTATAFSQILAISGASRGLGELAANLPVSPILVVVAMMFAIFVLGCFMESITIMMITIPIFMPIIHTLGFNPIWFAILFLINVETGGITPPFGLILYVVKGIAPPGTTMIDIIRAVFPFIVCNIVVLGILVAFPALPLWLPDLML